MNEINEMNEMNEMNDSNKNAEGIYKYIDIGGVRKLLINNPTLCVLFELICIHINSIIVTT